MQVTLFDGPGQPLRLASRPDPTPADGELVVRVHRCGICGTDFSMTSGEPPHYPPGCVPGHEFSGEVVATGRCSDEFAVGDRITTMGYAGCGDCSHCRAGKPLWCAQMHGVDGGFGEYAAVPAGVCIRLPDDLSLADGALVEPLACGLHAVNLCGDLRGSEVLILGAGGIGLAVVYWANRAGAASITVAARSRRSEARARAMGATAFATLDALPPEARYPLVFEATGGAGQLACAIDRALPHGQVVVAGLCTRADTIYPGAALMKELQLRFAVGYSLAELQHTADRMAADALDLGHAYVGETIGLDTLSATFERLRGDGFHGKVLVDPGRRVRGD